MNGFSLISDIADHLRYEHALGRWSPTHDLLNEAGYALAIMMELLNAAPQQDQGNQGGEGVGERPPGVRDSSQEDSSVGGGGPVLEGTGERPADRPPEGGSEVPSQGGGLQDAGAVAGKKRRSPAKTRQAAADGAAAVAGVRGVAAGVHEDV